jgi:ATP-dependent Clp protease ATP-binding subunit ClpA
MPTFVPDLETTLRKAIALATELRHAYAAPEHLLLALTEDRNALEVLDACTCDISRLRTSLETHLKGRLEPLRDGEPPIRAAHFTASSSEP